MLFRFSDVGMCKSRTFSHSSYRWVRVPYPKAMIFEDISHSPNFSHESEWTNLLIIQNICRVGRVFFPFVLSLWFIQGTWEHRPPHSDTTLGSLNMAISTSQVPVRTLPRLPGVKLSAVMGSFVLAQQLIWHEYFNYRTKVTFLF